jgi:hypothetical protein
MSAAVVCARVYFGYPMFVLARQFGTPDQARVEVKVIFSLRGRSAAAVRRGS